MNMINILKKLKPNKDWDLKERDKWLKENDGKATADTVVVVLPDE